MTDTIPAADTELLDQASRTVLEVADDPERRYMLCQDFYSRYGFGPGAGYGVSELDFLRWEIERGVLNPMTSDRPGSRWWRNVNAGLLSHAACAAAVHESGRDVEVSGPVKYWLAYLRSPSPQSWYRAHNASTVDGYLTHVEAARFEAAAEQTFINVVLYRVLYAQALVEGDAPGLLGAVAHHDLHGLLSDLERVVASPRSPSVDVLLHLPDFYPRHYPLAPQDELDILGHGHGPEALAQVLLDKVLVSPCLTKLYGLAADWLDMPGLGALVVDNRPAYPNIDAAR